MAAEDSPSKISFAEYAWEQDEEWQILIKKLEFPGSFDDAKKEKYVLKRKQRYFQENVDPDFVPTVPVRSNQHQRPAEAASKPAPPTQSNPHDHDDRDSATGAVTDELDDEPAPQPATSSSTSSSSTSSSSYGQRANPYGAYQAPSTKIGQLLSPFLNYYYLLSQWFVLISCLLSLVSPRWYYRALYATVLMYTVNTLQKTGKPQMNMYYAQRVMQDENVMIAIYAAIFLIGNPVFVFLSPILLRSFFTGVSLLSSALYAKVPSVYHKFRPRFQMVLSKRGWFIQQIAMLEVLVGFFLVAACLFMSRTVMLTFIYWQIMHARYMMSPQIQSAFSVVHAKLQSLLSRVPFVLNLYLKMSAYLAQMVNPQRLQEQMQDQQARTGLSKYCEIM